VGLLRDDPHPDEHAIRAGIEGNLCRCTGYHNVVKAVQSAARKLATAPAEAAPTRTQGR
jgi:aerobic carbon-monoxide dehydrogenase small subunit